MKAPALLLFALLGSILCQCSPKQEAKPKVDYDQASVQLMNELAPQVVGQWTMRQLQVKYRKNDPYQSEINLKNDSTFRDFATLTITPAATPRTSSVDRRQGEYDGTIRYGGKTYPVQFNMLAASDWVFNKKGPQTIFCLNTTFQMAHTGQNPKRCF